MSRLTQVQYEQVASACAELFRAGDSVSFAKVYRGLLVFSAISDGTKS